MSFTLAWYKTGHSTPSRLSVKTFCKEKESCGKSDHYHYTLAIRVYVCATIAKSGYTTWSGCGWYGPF